VVHENVSKLEKELDVYEAHLSKNKYLAGDFYSIADLVHIPYTYFLIKYTTKGHVITSRKHVKAWFDDICARKSWQKIVKEYLNES
jgi:glutathione S-transferase